MKGKKNVSGPKEDRKVQTYGGRSWGKWRNREGEGTKREDVGEEIQVEGRHNRRRWR